MSETRKESSDRALLKALGEWPETSLPEETWEEKAKKVEQAIAEAEKSGGGVKSVGRSAPGARGAHIPAVSDDKLLSAPLPSMPEEGHNSALSEPRRSNPGVILSDAPKAEGKMRTERERRSFQDLARMATTPPPGSVRPSQPPQPPSGVIRAAEAQSSDSGVVDLKLAAASDPMAAARSSQTPLASSGLFEDEEARNSQPPMSGPASQRISQPIASGPLSQPLSGPVSAIAVPSSPQSLSQPVVAAKSEKGEKSEKKKSGALVLGVGVVAIAAMAAGAFFVVKNQQAKKAQAVAATTLAAPDTKAEAANPAPEATSPAVAQADDRPDPAASPAAGADKGDPKPSVGGAAKVALTKKPAGGAAAAAPKVTAPEAKSAPDKAPPPIDPKLVAKDLPPAPGPSSGQLSDAMKAAAGTSAPQADTNALQQIAEPQFAPGSVPQKPSQGAVTGAINSQLAAARACLKPDSPLSRATVTFGSNGGVQSVTVSGAAAGKPEEACIKAAFGKAKVPPFAQPTYSANVNVRPN